MGYTRADLDTALSQTPLGNLDSKNPFSALLYKNSARFPKSRKTLSTRQQEKKYYVQADSS
jgi:hypothetical protein